MTLGLDLRPGPVPSSLVPSGRRTFVARVSRFSLQYRTFLLSPVVACSPLLHCTIVLVLLMNRTRTRSPQSRVNDAERQLKDSIDAHSVPDADTRRIANEDATVNGFDCDPASVPGRIMTWSTTASFTRPCSPYNISLFTKNMLFTICSTRLEQLDTLEPVARDPATYRYFCVRKYLVMHFFRSLNNTIRSTFVSSTTPMTSMSTSEPMMTFVR